MHKVAQILEMELNSCGLMHSMPVLYIFCMYALQNFRPITSIIDFHLIHQLSRTPCGIHQKRWWRCQSYILWHPVSCGWNYKYCRSMGLHLIALVRNFNLQIEPWQWPKTARRLGTYQGSCILSWARPSVALVGIVRDAGQLQSQYNWHLSKTRSNYKSL